MTFLVTQPLPKIIAAAVNIDNKIEDNFDYNKYIKDTIGVLLFYPLDFTFVCPSELIALDSKMNEFNKRNVKVAAVSVDSQFSHLAYKNTPRNKGGIGHVKYPLISDLTKNITQACGFLKDNLIAFRGTLIIDQNGIVRHQSINDLPLGRNIDEILRIIDALEHYQMHGEVCPANWTVGKAAITPTSEGIVNYLAENSEKL
jgi:peroxiredoxin (alkyl hydroperoxide reductase subunit C)